MRERKSQWISKKLRLVYYFTRDTSNECRRWLGKITTKCGCPFFLRSVTDMWIRCVTMSLLVLTFSVSLKKRLCQSNAWRSEPWHSGSAQAQGYSAPVGTQLWKMLSNQKIKKQKYFPCYLVLPCSRRVTR